MSDPAGDAKSALLAVADPRGSRADIVAALTARAEAADIAVHVSAADEAESALAILLGGGNARHLRIGVVGVGAGADAALRAAANDGRVAALAFIDAQLAPDAIALVGDWPEVPLIAVGDPAARAGLTGAVDAYLASGHQASELVVEGIGEHTAAVVTSWLALRLAQRACVDEVVMETAQGWRLHGTRWLPSAHHPVPGVVLLHTGRSDRAAFARLERLLAERGFAVLNFDWRGRGQSINRGTYFGLSAEERAAAWQDAAAALQHLAERPEVDADRLGAVGVVHGAEYAVRAAMRDSRVKALALLTGYRPAEDAEGVHLTSGDVDVLYVTSTDHSITTDAMRSLYEASPGRHTRYVEYPGGAIGYQLFELDPDLEPDVVEWLAEVLLP